MSASGACSREEPQPFGRALRVGAVGIARRQPMARLTDVELSAVVLVFEVEQRFVGYLRDDDAAELLDRISSSSVGESAGNFWPLLGDREEACSLLRCAGLDAPSFVWNKDNHTS